MTIATPKQQTLELLRAMLNMQADFRPGQWEAIESVAIHRKRALVVQRTGSRTYTAHQSFALAHAKSNNHCRNKPVYVGVPRQIAIFKTDTQNPSGLFWIFQRPKDLMRHEYPVACISGGFLQHASFYQFIDIALGSHVGYIQSGLQLS